MKKFFSVALSFSLVFSTFSTSVFAEGDPEEPLVEVLEEGTEEEGTEEGTEEEGTEEGTEEEGTEEEGTEEGTEEEGIEEEGTEEEGTEEEGTEETEPAGPEESEVVDELEITQDKTDRTETGGFKVEIFYSEDDNTVGYVPTFTLAHRDAVGKTISTVKAGEQNFDPETNSYKLAFNNPGYKLGEEYQLYLEEAESIIDSLSMHVSYFEGDDLITETTVLEKDQFFTFTIGSQVFYDDEENAYLDLSPNANTILNGNLATDGSKVGIYLVSENGNPQKNVPIMLRTTDSEEFIDLFTNSRGVAWVDTDKLSQIFRVYVEDRAVIGTDSGNATLQLPVWLVADPDSQKNALTYVLEVENRVEAGTPESTSGIVTVNTGVTGNTDLSTNWATADLTFTKDDDVFSFVVSHGTEDLYGLEEGTYNVKATSDYAEVSLSSSTVTVKDGKATLNVSLKPKYQLRVDQDGEEYKFAFLNVAGLEEKTYSGKEPVYFAVTPGESYMVEDKETGEVWTVSIDPNNTLTRLILGVGLVFSGPGGTPHTSDKIYFLVAMFLLSLLGAFVGFTLYKKSNKNINLRNASLSVLLIASLLLPYLPANTADASTIGSGSPGSVSGGTQSPAGVIQTSGNADGNVSALKVGFILNRPDFSRGSNVLRDDSRKSELENPFKFSHTNLDGMFYITSNPTHDQVLRRDTSAIIHFDTNGTQVTYGNSHPLFSGSGVNTPLNNKAALNRRILPQAETGVTSSNAFESYVAHAIMYLNDSTSNNRKLWQNSENSSSNRNIGDVLEGQGGPYAQWLANRSPQPAWFDRTTGTINSNMIFEGYVEKLREVGADSYADAITVQFLNSDPEDYSFFMEVMQSFYIAGTHGSNRHHAFMTISDASQWYLYGRNNETGGRYNNVHRHHEYHIMYGLSPNNSSVVATSSAENGGLQSSPWARHAPTSTYVHNTRRSTGIALKPETTRVPIASNPNTQNAIQTNPFGGWGYVPDMGSSMQYDNQPRFDAIAEITVVDENGRATGTKFTQEVPGWRVGDVRRLENINIDDDILGSMQVVSNGRLYNIVPDNRARISFVDKADSENIIRLDGTSRNARISVPSFWDSSSWAVEWLFDTPHPHDTHTHLGGSDGLTSTIPNKYEDNPEYFSNAQLKVELKAVEVTSTRVPTALTGGSGIPQWRLSQHLGPVEIDERRDNAMHIIDIPRDSGENGRLRPTGNQTFKVNKAEGTSWLSTKTVYKDGDSYVSPRSSLMRQNIQLPEMPSNSFGSYFPLSVDLLAVKDNSSIGNTRLASWVNNFSILDGRIGTTSRGSAQPDRSNVQRSTELEVSASSPVSKYTYSETVKGFRFNNATNNRVERDYPGYSLTNFRNTDGEFYTYRGIKEAGSLALVSQTHVFDSTSSNNTYEWSVALGMDNNTANKIFDEVLTTGTLTVSKEAKQTEIPTIFDITLDFRRYTPSTNSSPKTFPEVKINEVEGYYFETKRSDVTLSINPEVLMAYDDDRGNTSVAFTAGDRLRTIRPIALNSVSFADIDVEPEIGGMSSSTDPKARQLASSLGAANAEVIYKGSAVTTNFDAGGDVELRTFALDIGNTALKNAWNPGTSYSTDVIFEEFMERHASKNADGKWELELEANGKLKVDGREYGGHTETTNVEQSADTEVTTHTLEIRGGQLVGVNGNRNLATVPEELTKVLTEMKILGSDNIFNNFERNAGDRLTESTVVNLGNALRGGSQLATNRGWYNEDTTVLVVREYVTTFELPIHVGVDKLPMEIPNLETPIDRNQFYSQGRTGHSILEYKVGEASLKFDSSIDGPWGSRSIDFIVPNVSVLDTLN